MTYFTEFKLDSRLANDCFELGHFKFSRLLLLNNALVPWFILVPETTATEIYDLPHPHQLELLDEINIISRYLKQNFTVDKLNVAAIGNIVKQLHIHIVARQIDDFCWPAVVWGAEGSQAYTENQVELIKQQLRDHLADTFTISQ